MVKKKRGGGESEKGISRRREYQERKRDCEAALRERSVTISKTECVHEKCR
jgi:hypothetical protein